MENKEEFNINLDIFPKEIRQKIINDIPLAELLMLCQYPNSNESLSLLQNECNDPYFWINRGIYQFGPKCKKTFPILGDESFIDLYKASYICCIISNYKNPKSKFYNNAMRELHNIEELILLNLEEMRQNEIQEFSSQNKENKNNKKKKKCYILSKTALHIFKKYLPKAAICGYGIVDIYMKVYESLLIHNFNLIINDLITILEIICDTKNSPQDLWKYFQDFPYSIINDILEMNFDPESGNFNERLLL